MTPQPLDHPTGTHTIHLKDIPEPIRRKAALKLMANTGNTDEYARLFELVWNPGEAGGRIA